MANHYNYKMDEGALQGKERKKSSIKLLCQSALVKLIFIGLVEPKPAFESFIGLADSRMASHLDKVVFLGLFIYFSYKVSSSIELSRIWVQNYRANNEKP